MKNPINNQTIITTKQIKENLNYKNISVLNIDMEYPEIKLDKGYLIQRKVNIKYLNIVNKFYNYAVKILLQEAIEQYKLDIKNNYPFNPYEVVMRYTVTLNDNCTLSTYIDQYQYTGGAHGSTLRLSNTWNLQTGKPINLKNLFPKNSDYKQTILNKVKEQAKLNLVANPGLYFDNYEQLIDDNFNEENFFLTPETLDIYYQQYEIAPYSTGIVVFSIPYNNLEIKATQCFNT